MELLRKKTKSLLIFSIVFAMVYYMLPDFQETQQTLGLPLSGSVIAIDPGHGGVDGGAVAEDGTVEKDIALEVSMQVRDYLQQAGALVVMTRDGDYDLANEDTKGYSKRKTEDLKKRTKLVNSSAAELLVSIHLNSIPSNKWSGAQCFYSKGRDDSQLLAKLIQDQLKDITGKTDRVPLADDRIYIIKEAKMPAVTVEVGFLSNPEETARMKQLDYQRKLAHAIYLGIAQYLTEVATMGNEQPPD
jgi:N-acetylmuramoyl-L-alanine amidase